MENVTEEKFNQFRKVQFSGRYNMLDLSGSEVAHAIAAYAFAHGAYVTGPRTVTVNGELCEHGEIFVDPSGSVVYDGKRYPG